MLQFNVVWAFLLPPLSPLLTSPVPPSALLQSSPFSIVLQSQSSSCFQICCYLWKWRMFGTWLCNFSPRHEGKSKGLCWAKLKPSFPFTVSLSNLRPWTAPLSASISTLKGFCYLLFYLGLRKEGILLTSLLTVTSLFRSKSNACVPLKRWKTLTRL